MFRQSMFAIVIVGLMGGLALGQQATTTQDAQVGGQKGKGQMVWGKIVKIDGNAITVMPYDPATKKFGTAKTYQVDPEGLQTYRMQGKDKREKLTGGLKGNAFQNIPETGLYSSMRLQGNRVNQIGLYNQAGFQAGASRPDGIGGTGGTGGTTGGVKGG